MSSIHFVLTGLGILHVMSGHELCVFSTRGTWDLQQSFTQKLEHLEVLEMFNSEVSCSISVAFHTSSSDYTFPFTS